MKPKTSAKTLHMKKVFVSAEMDGTDQPFSFEFIYGVAPHGLTPLEMMLADKGEGDELKLELSQAQIQEVFGHIGFLIPTIRQDPVIMHLKVERVEEPDQREVIKAMAEAASSCDCCGGH